MGSLPQVSIYIPVFNAAHFLPHCVAAIRAQTHTVDEIIVVDDGSADNIADVARELSVTLQVHECNKGLAAARNTGVSCARNELVASLDADCCPEPEWLATLVAEVQRSSNIAAVSGVLYEKNQSDFPDRWRAYHMAQGWGDDRIKNPLHLFGNNMLLRKSMLQEVGMYKESPEYRTNNEDYYISRQLLDKGFGLIYNPRAIVWHLRKDSFYSVFRTYWRWFYLHRTNPGTPRKLLQKWAVNAKWAVTFMGRDKRSKRYAMIPIDLLFFLYQSYFDVKFFFTKTV